MAWFGRRRKEAPRGHLRVYAEKSGKLTGVEVLSPLLAEEVAPALEAAMQSLAERRATSAAARLEAHKKALRGKAGMLDRLRGRVTHREEAAEEVVPGERFEGRAGPVLVRVDGRFQYLSLSVDEGADAREAGASLPRALEEACKACEARWEQVILGPPEGSTEGEEAGEPGGAEEAAEARAAGPPEGAG